MHGLPSHIINLWHLRWVGRFWTKESEKTDHVTLLQSFGELAHRPLLVDLTVEEQTRLKVIYGSADGFHAVDLDSATVYDIYLPKHVSLIYPVAPLSQS